MLWEVLGKRPIDAYFAKVQTVDPNTSRQTTEEKFQPRRPAERRRSEDLRHCLGHQWALRDASAGTDWKGGSFLPEQISAINYKKVPG